MKNEKIFIGNLSFNATEDDVRGLLSESGTVVSIRLSKKKGHAVVEMSEREESEAIIRNLDGKSFMDRTLRVNFELPPKKAKSASIKRFDEKGRSLSSEKNELQPKSHSQAKETRRPGNSSESRTGMRASDHQKARTRDGYRGAARGNRRDDSDDSRGNRKYPEEKERATDRESSGGYYSQSFRKRAEKAAHAFSKFKIKDKFSGHTDDFMKDEQGRDYRDMEKEADRKHSGPRSRPASANRESGSSYRGSGNSYTGDRSSQPGRTRGNSGESSGRNTGNRSGRPSGNTPRGNSKSGSVYSSGEKRGTSSRGVSKSRPAERTRNKQR